jgi:DNA-binding CsgD family transcriptional regulator
LSNINLNDTQLQIVMHLCNGKTLEEISVEMHYSLTNIKRYLTDAKRRTNARSNVHLASLVIASGVLFYTDQGERLHMPSDGNGAGLPAARYSA